MRYRESLRLVPNEFWSRPACTPLHRVGLKWNANATRSLMASSSCISIVIVPPSTTLIDFRADSMVYSIDALARPIHCRLPARACHRLRTARRGHLLQLGHPEPGRPPHRLHTDHLRHSPDRAAGRADHGPRRRADLPVHIRQCRRGGGPVGQHLHEEHDPGAALSEPAGNLPRPPAQGL